MLYHKLFKKKSYLISKLESIIKKTNKNIIVILKFEKLYQFVCC